MVLPIIGIVLGMWTVADVGLALTTEKDSIDYLLEWLGLSGSTVTDPPVGPEPMGLWDFIGGYSIEIMLIAFVVIMASCYALSKPRGT